MTGRVRSVTIEHSISVRFFLLFSMLPRQRDQTLNSVQLESGRLRPIKRPSAAFTVCCHVSRTGRTPSASGHFVTQRPVEDRRQHLHYFH